MWDVVEDNFPGVIKALVVWPPPWHAQLVLKALEARKARNELPEGFVLAEAPPDEASSTRVRELCKAGQWNALAASGLLHPAVVDALSERRWLQD